MLKVRFRLALCFLVPCSCTDRVSSFDESLADKSTSMTIQSSTGSSHVERFRTDEEIDLVDELYSTVDSYEDTGLHRAQGGLDSGMGEAQSPSPIDDTSRWISGLIPRGGHLDRSLIEDPQWRTYAARIDRLWTDAMRPVLDRMTAWAQERIDPDDHRAVFYPFSGPDILNALHLYPQSHDYLLIALENEGAIPPLPKALDKETLKGLKTLESYVRGHVLRNFFITHEMGGKTDKAGLGSHLYTGVSSLILFFLVRSGHEIIKMRSVSLSPSGRLKGVSDPSQLTAPYVSGVEILFRKLSESSEDKGNHQSSPALTQRVVFLKANISDTNISQALGLIPFILSYGSFNSLVKAASYLMHYSNFDSIRNLLLSRSHHIISDDTGIPFHFFNENPNDWRLELYGSYTRPNPSSKTFAKHCQLDFKKAMKEKGLGSLPFRFGYYLKQPNLLFATRQTKIKEPHIDFDLYQGISTVYYGDKNCQKGKQHLVKQREPRKGK